jgi:hypothetical protein
VANPAAGDPGFGEGAAGDSDALPDMRDNEPTFEEAMGALEEAMGQSGEGGQGQQAGSAGEGGAMGEGGGGHAGGSAATRAAIPPAAAHRVSRAAPGPAAP